MSVNLPGTRMRLKVEAFNIRKHILRVDNQVFFRVYPEAFFVFAVLTSKLIAGDGKILMEEDNEAILRGAIGGTACFLQI